MKTISAILVGSILLLFASGKTLGQERNHLFVPTPAQYQDDDKRKGLEICTTYDETGKVAKISIKSKPTDKEGKFRSILNRETTMAVIDELVPEIDRGEKMRENSTYGKLIITSIVYERVRFNLSIFCEEGSCGISYAEILFRILEY